MAKLVAIVTYDDSLKRRKYNLTHPDVFEQDFAKLVTEITRIVPSSTNVFVGTIPKVTIPPITQGIGSMQEDYFEYYGRFFSSEDNFSRFLQNHLTRAEAKQIDLRIDSFNQTIQNTVDSQSGNWHIVDVGEVLNSLAVKRNNASDAPGRVLREYYAKFGISDHPLLNLDPIPNTLRLDTKNGQRLAGGLFSLDCIHPTTIGYGIVAEAFLRKMQQANVENADPARLNWTEIINGDTLIQSPPILWDDIVMAAQSNATLWNVIFSVVG